MKRSHLIAILVLVALLVASIWLFGPRRPSAPIDTASTKGQVLYWYDPMRPEVHFDKPGKSPFMDMQLVAKYAGEAAGASGLIAIDPRVVQSLGIRTVPAEAGHFARVVRTTGIVTANEKAVQVVQARASGWVERLHVRTAGEVVRRGELLAEIYSPDLLAAEHELIVAAHAGESAGVPPLAAAARSRLSLLGLTDEQIGAIEKSGRTERRVAFLSPLNGVVTDLGVREGAQVAPGMNLFTIADLSRVWVTAQITEAQASWVLQGQSVEARVLALPGRTFTGTVDYVYPDLMPDTRTLRARVVLDNAHLDLKPGMYADVTLHGGSDEEALLVPSEALIRTGTRSTIIVADGGGRFHPVEVVAGDEADGRVAILKGLEPGVQVVSSGQFLIDSEANLRGAFSEMTAPPAAAGGHP